MMSSFPLQRRTVLAAGVLAVSAAFGANQAAALSPTDQAQALVDKASRDLVAVVNGSTADGTKSSAMAQIINTAVDVDGIGRFCLGRFWRIATPAEQKAYIDLFHHVLMTNITSKIGEYKGVSITLERAVQREDGVIVASTVVRPNQAPNKVDWLVSFESGAPLIVDVIAEGTSLRLTQRNDYASYLSHNNNSVAALLDALKKQAITSQG